MPKVIKRSELEFHTALKKAMGIRDMKTKHSKSMESYLARIVSFPCLLDMVNLLSLCHALLFDPCFQPQSIPTMLCHTSIPTMKITVMCDT